MPYSDILIRSLTSADVSAIRNLHSIVLPVEYPPAFFTQLLILPTRACLIAVRRSQPSTPIAFISAAFHKPSSITILSPTSKALDTSRPRVEILTLGVLPTFQHRGLARHLIKSVVNKLCGPLNAGVAVYANVATTNTSALKFYESIGMRVSSDVIHNLYRTCPHGSRDAYLVSGRLCEI